VTAGVLSPNVQTREVTMPVEVSVKEKFVTPAVPAVAEAEILATGAGWTTVNDASFDGDELPEALYATT
jgi:hypothetical protein